MCSAKSKYWLSLLPSSLSPAPQVLGRRYIVSLRIIGDEEDSHLEYIHEVVRSVAFFLAPSAELKLLTTGLYFVAGCNSVDH